MQDFIQRQMEEIQRLFANKKQSYGDTVDLFYNFRQSAIRIFNDESFDAQFKILTTLADKHWVALCKNGLADAEVEERLKDMILYCLIGLKMLDVMQE